MIESIVFSTVLIILGLGFLNKLNTFLTRPIHNNKRLKEGTSDALSVFGVCLIVSGLIGLLIVVIRI